MKIQAVLATCLLAFGCRGDVLQTSNCKPLLPREELIRIVEREVRRQGGELRKDRQSRIEITREGCGYLYREIFLPEIPGDYLIVRLDEDGKVLDLIAGH